MQVDRRQVLAYRMAVQGLHRDRDDVPDLAVLDLGVQDTPPGSAVQALAVRSGSAPGAIGTDGRLAVTWTVRGAPHVHRSDDLRGLAAALWPVSDADAVARLDTSAAPVRKAPMGPREALRFVAEQLAEIVTQPMHKGEASAALTPRIPPELTVDCRPCKATHIVETLFRTAVLPAGLTFAPAERAVVFTPVVDWPGPPRASAGVHELLAAYLHLHGPAGLADAATFLGAHARDLEAHAPQDIAPVDVVLDDGQRRPGFARTNALELLADPPAPPPLRLVPPSDPYLQARDRAVLVPDGAQRKLLWPTLGRPGAVLAEGAVAGIWRARKAGRRLDLRVECFASLPRAASDHLEHEAALVAAARNAASVALTVE